MMIKKMLCALLCISVLAPLAGCWSRREPKTLAIINSAIYDLTEDGQYQITAEIMNPSTQGGGVENESEKSPNSTVISKGDSIPEAIRAASESLELTLFGGHTKARFFSERFIEKDLCPTLDYFQRDPLIDERPLMIVVKDEEDPNRIYSCKLGLSNTVGDYIESLSKSHPDTTSRAVFVTVLGFIKDYYDEGKQPVAGLIELVECQAKYSKNTDIGGENNEEKEYRIKYEGLTAFKDSVMVGYMDGIEARAYNFITNNMQRTVASVVVEDDIIGLLINGSKAKIKAAVQDDQFTFDVSIKIGMSLVQAGSNLDISKADPLKKAEQAFNQQMEKEINGAIEKAQKEFESDIFGFGKTVHIQHPQKWQEIKENWDDYFTKAVINVTVESSIDRSGQIKQTFTMES